MSLKIALYLQTCKNRPVKDSQHWQQEVLYCQVRQHRAMMALLNYDGKLSNSSRYSRHGIKSWSYLNATRRVQTRSFGRIWPNFVIG